MPAIHRLCDPLAQARGVIGRHPDTHEEYRFVFDSVGRRLVHMIGVRQPLLVGFYRDGTLVAETTLSPWTGVAFERADLIIETHPSNTLPRRLE